MTTFSLFSVTFRQTAPELFVASVKEEIFKRKDEDEEDKSVINESQTRETADNTSTSTEVESVGAVSDSLGEIENNGDRKEPALENSEKPASEDPEKPASDVNSQAEVDVKEQKKPTKSDSVESDDYVFPIAVDELLRGILKRYKVKNSTWVKSIDNVTTMVTFMVESGRIEEDVLDALVTCGIGNEPGTSVSISPTTVCLSVDLKKQGKSKKETSEPAKSSCDLPEKPPKDSDVSPVPEAKQVLTGAPKCLELTDGEGESDVLLMEKGEEEESCVDGADVEEGDFMKSIKARIIIQPIVATLRRNAEFTFDYLVFIILASIISAVGLIENNSVILVASMLISPLMGPILAATFGSAVDDVGLRNVGVKSELIGLFICILTGFLVGLPATYIMTSGSDWKPVADSWPSPAMYDRGLPRSVLVGAVIALVSGMAVALSVLGNNQGSLVGVAISASLLPPAVNSGLLWAYSLQAGISGMSSHDTMELPDISNSTLMTATAACPALTGNAYTPHFYCDMAKETFVLGVISLVLTIVNIVLIVLAAMLCLKVKQVSPRASVDNEQMFWMKHMKVAKHYNTTVHPSSNLGAALIKDLKTALKVSDDEAQRILEDRQFLRQSLHLWRSNSEDNVRPQKNVSRQSEDNSLLLRSLSHAPQLESTGFRKKNVHKRGRFEVVKD